MISLVGIRQARGHELMAYALMLCNHSHRTEDGIHIQVLDARSKALDIHTNVFVLQTADFIYSAALLTTSLRVESLPLTLVPGQPTHITVLVHPAQAEGGRAFGVQPIVMTADDYENFICFADRQYISMDTCRTDTGVCVQMKYVAEQTYGVAAFRDAMLDEVSTACTS